MGSDIPVPRRARGPAINTCSSERRYPRLNDECCGSGAAPFCTKRLTFEPRCNSVRPPSVQGDTRQCIEIGFLLKQVIEQLGLKLLAKVSGSKGIQVYVR